MMQYQKYRIITLLFAGLLSIAGCDAQNETGKQSLSLFQTISLPGVKGRIDHIDMDLKSGVVYIAALGNNTVEVVDLKSGKVTGTITGLDEPQGLAYIARHKEIFVANGGTGECDFYDAGTYKKTATIKLTDDADDVRYDAGADRIYVGYGSGGIAIIDAGSHKLVAGIPLPAHPESFQLDVKAGKLWVNLPGAAMIGVIDLGQLKLSAKWPELFPRSNFPMAYDDEQHRLMVGYRLPARLVVYDSETGGEIFSAPMIGDADDLYWDKENKSIYISGGSGAVNIFKRTNGIYRQTANIKTRDGARTSLLVPESGLLLIGARAEGGQNAALMVYKIKE
jgi:YVTN family beta-propeller protein